MILMGSLYIILTEPHSDDSIPTLYWVTDANPTRYQQIELFHDWLIQNKHTTPEGNAIVRIKLETGGIDNKKLIHGVSGVAGDLIDLSDIDQYQKLGILEDVTEQGKSLGFDIHQTFPSLKPSLYFNDKQYGYPCNVSIHSCWVNTETFAKLEMEAPPEKWDVETFEKIGKEFVLKANKEKERQEVFFMNKPSDWLLIPWLTTLIRSMGQSTFNETLTDSTLDQGAFAEALRLNLKWVEEDHLFPSSAEASSFNSEGGFGGSLMSLFLEGNYGMITTGRWVLVRLRDLEEPPRVSVSRYPFKYFENSVVMTRAACIYKGSKHKKLAALFLSFLASQTYNEQIVQCADALPSNPKYLHSNEFLKPIHFPNEWGAHEVPARSAQEISIAETKSPYISYSSIVKVIREADEKVQNHISEPVEAAKEANLAIREEIQRNLKHRPKLKKQFDKDKFRQNQINRMKENGEKIPTSLISNPFYKKYYNDKK